MKTKRSSSFRAVLAEPVIVRDAPNGHSFGYTSIWVYGTIGRATS